jgi:cell division initiation protein
MKIAPIDIAHKTFARKVMGLDADEVADFLRDIADQMEELVREKNSLKETLRQKDLLLLDYKDRDDSLKQTIQTAAKMSEGIRTDAEREAKLIVNDAHQKAEMILRDSRDSLKRVYQEINDIKRMRMQFEVNLRSFCQAHIAMLDQSHVMLPDPSVNLTHAAATTAHNTNQAAANASTGAQIGAAVAAAPQARNTVANAPLKY